MLVLSIENTPVAPERVSVRLPVRFAPLTVKPSRYAPFGTPLKLNEDGLTVIVGVTAVPFNETVIPLLMLTVALWVPAEVGLYVTVTVAPLRA